MEKISKKFKGKVVAARPRTTLGFPVEKRGRLEIENGWAHLYNEEPTGGKYSMPINLHGDSVSSIVAINN